MEIKGNVEVQGFTRICDLETGAVFVFCDDENELMLKGCNYDESITYVIRLSNGEVYDMYEKSWSERPVRQIKAVLNWGNR